MAYAVAVVLHTLEADGAQTHFNVRFLDLQAQIITQTVQS